MARFLRVALFVQAGLLMLAIPADAQLRTGELTSSLSGTISPGYTADYGNMTPSDHSWEIGGVFNYSGSFYSPSFLSFDASYYLNQSRANSNFQSISNASGVDLSANIFGGSRFPGSVSYSKAYNSEGNYAVPGLANFVTHGNSDSFAINWGVNLPDAPTFSAGFQMGSSKYSVYGTNDEGKNAFHSVNLHSGYTWEGFNMGAYFTSGRSHAQIPQVLVGATTTQTQSDSKSYGFNVMHSLPMQGSVSTSINRSDWNSAYLGTSTNGAIDIINTMVALHPTGKLSLSGTASYSDNLSGQLIESVVNAGSVVEGFNSNQSSNSLDLMAVLSYTPILSIQVSGYAERRTQLFLGTNYGVNSVGGSASYARKLPVGNFSASLSATENTADKTDEQTLGFSTNENYSSEFRGWQVNAAFGYSQNVETLLVTYMNSFYNYSGSARRRWGKFNVSAGMGGARTALTDQPGTSNSSQSFAASMGYSRWITANGSYSKASGQALITGTGLVPVPVPSPTLPDNLVSLFGGDSYSFAVSSSPAKGLVITGAYEKSLSSTSSDSLTSANNNNEFNTLIQYQVRKLNFNSGFARLEQGFSGSGTPPQIISSFYVGVSRWFKFF